MSKLTKEEKQAAKAEKKAQKEAKKAEKATKKKFEKMLDTYLDELGKGCKYVGEVNYINNLRKVKPTVKPGNMVSVKANQRIYMWTGKRFFNITPEA